MMQAGFPHASYTDGLRAGPQVLCLRINSTQEQICSRKIRLHALYTTSNHPAYGSSHFFGSFFSHILTDLSQKLFSIAFHANFTSKSTEDWVFKNC